MIGYIQLWELLKKNNYYKTLTELVVKDTISVNYEKESIDFELLINYLKEKNLKILDISIDEGDLEDVFIQLTKN